MRKGDYLYIRYIFIAGLLIMLQAALLLIAIDIDRWTGHGMPGYADYISRWFRGPSIRTGDFKPDIPYYWLSIQICYILGCSDEISRDLNDGCIMKLIRIPDRKVWWKRKIRQLLCYTVSFFLCLYMMIIITVAITGGMNSDVHIWDAGYSDTRLLNKTIICLIFIQASLGICAGMFQMLMEMLTRQTVGICINISIALMSAFPTVADKSPYRYTMIDRLYDLAISSNYSIYLVSVLIIAVFSAIAMILYIIGGRRAKKVEFL
ncbi:MAG: hypothetical protein SPL57_00225 [Lachnospiraceae bacterium]|nr:hypothetical protein [Lachnospiraceae bacterium]